MTNCVLISHSLVDGETAAYLAADLERLGVQVMLQPAGNEQAVHGARAVVALLGQAITPADGVWVDADRAARAGKPLYAVHLREGGGDPLAGMPVRQSIDAFGPLAAANVERLAVELRSLPSGAAPAWGAQPPGSQSYNSSFQSPRQSGARPWLIAGGVLGAVIAVIGVLEITEVIDIFESGSTSSYAGSTSGASNTSSGGVTNGPGLAPPRGGSSGKDYLPGRWSRSGDCSRAMNFLPDGTLITAEGMSGTWSASGSMGSYPLEMTVGGQTLRGTVSRHSDDSATLMPTDGSPPLQLTRCADTGGGGGPPLQNAPSSRRIAGSITDADYPASAIRAGAQGSVRARLTIDASGAVTGCSILLSSGNSALDSTTCSLMQRRFRYAPGSQTSLEETATWSLPQ